MSTAGVQRTGVQSIPTRLIQHEVTPSPSLVGAPAFEQFAFEKRPELARKHKKWSPDRLAREVELAWQLLPEHEKEQWRQRVYDGKTLDDTVMGYDESALDARVAREKFKLVKHGQDITLTPKPTDLGEKEKDDSDINEDKQEKWQGEPGGSRASGLMGALSSGLQNLGDKLGLGGDKQEEEQEEQPKSNELDMDKNKGDQQEQGGLLHRFIDKLNPLHHGHSKDKQDDNKNKQTPSSSEHWDKQLDLQKHKGTKGGTTGKAGQQSDKSDKGGVIDTKDLQTMQSQSYVDKEQDEAVGGLLSGLADKFKSTVSDAVDSIKSTVGLSDDSSASQEEDKSSDKSDESKESDAKPKERTAGKGADGLRAKLLQKAAALLPGQSGLKERVEEGSLDEAEKRTERAGGDKSDWDSNKNLHGNMENVALQGSSGQSRNARRQKARRMRAKLSKAGGLNSSMSVEDQLKAVPNGVSHLNAPMGWHDSVANPLTTTHAPLNHPNKKTANRTTEQLKELLSSDISNLSGASNHTAHKKKKHGKMAKGRFERQQEVGHEAREAGMHLTPESHKRHSLQKKGFGTNDEIKTMEYPDFAHEENKKWRREREMRHAEEKKYGDITA